MSEEHTKEGYSQTFAGLIRKRAELAGVVERASETMRKAIRELEHIDATIRIFDPDYRVEEIKPKSFRPPEDWAKRGQMIRLVMQVLRHAAEPLTARDIAIRIMSERGMNTDDDKQIQQVMRRVGSPLRRLREQNVTESVNIAGQFVTWRLKA